MSDLLSAAYDTFGSCHRCGSHDVTPATESFHVRGECVMGQRDRALAAATKLRTALVEHHMPGACPDCDEALAATAWLEDR